MKNDFDPDLIKKAKEVIFSGKTKKLVHTCLLFKDIILKNIQSSN